jgi:hypothetical protein
VDAEPHNTTQNHYKLSQSFHSLLLQVLFEFICIIVMKSFGVLAVALMFVLCLADDEHEPVTCGSSIKLLHDPSVSK